jgi:hypothetical protein
MYVLGVADDVELLLCVNFSYVWSGLIVVLGIYLNVYSKNQSAWDARFKEWFKRFIPQHRRLVALQNLQHAV